MWLDLSSSLNALISHAVQGLLCNLPAQHFSGQCLNYVPAGRSPILTGSSRFLGKKWRSLVIMAEHFVAKWMLGLAAVSL